MREELQIHNLFKESAERFFSDDPHLKRAGSGPYLFESGLMNNPSLMQPGIFSVTGGRQVGKTTFLKQFIGRLLKGGKIPAARIFFLAGEIIPDDYALRMELQAALENSSGRTFIFIDEVSYIRDWDKAVKYLADAGWLDQTTLILSGSDSGIIQQAMKRFAGRRGRADQVDFIFFPLTFCETALLKKSPLNGLFQRIQKSPLTDKVEGWEESYELLAAFFGEYLVHGGYLTAMTDMAREGQITKSTFRTYSEWIRGDILKHHKQEKYLLEVLKGIAETYLSQITWNSLAKRMSIEHHKTVSDYVLLLEELHVIFIHEALAEHTLSAAPKKAKKIHFHDPFIYRAVKNLLQMDCGQEDIPGLAETAVVSGLRRKFKSFYIKGGKGEVDQVIIDGRRLLPIEVKWTNTLRREDLKQIYSYPRGLIADKGRRVSLLDGMVRVPIVRLLIQAESGLINIDGSREGMFRATGNGSTQNTVNS